jgi:hypothetical protein
VFTDLDTIVAASIAGIVCFIFGVIVRHLFDDGTGQPSEWGEKYAPCVYPRQGAAPMHPELLKGSIASIVRWLIPFLLGWLGIEWSEDRIGEAATALTVLIVMGLSILHSINEKKKLLRQQPAPPSEPGAGASA